MSIFSNSFDLVWEKSFGDKIGFYKPIPRKIFTPSMMKNLAVAKMTSIKLISADFKENPISFEPLLWILCEHSNSLEFNGIYTSEYFDDNENVSIINTESNIYPSICIRKAFWNKSEDTKQFNLSDNKKQYIIGENQTTSNLYFFDNIQIPLIKKFLLEIINIFDCGLNFKNPSLRKSSFDFSDYNKIQINVLDNRFNFDFTYHPNFMTSDSIENWLIEWQKYINELPIEISYLPDENFRISYNSSLFDQINFLIDKF